MLWFRSVASKHELLQPICAFRRDLYIVQSNYGRKPKQYEPRFVRKRSIIHRIRDLIWVLPISFTIYIYKIIHEWLGVFRQLHAFFQTQAMVQGRLCLWSTDRSDDFTLLTLAQTHFVQTSNKGIVAFMFINHSERTLRRISPIR